MKLVRLLLAAAPLALAAPLSAQRTHEHPAAASPNEHSPALHAQIEAARRGTERYRDHAAAVRDGYRLFGGEGALMGEHWYRPELVGRPLDLEHPSTLQYATVGGRKVLVGVAYTVYRRPGEPLPEGFAGNADHWHVHDVEKLARAIVSDRPLLRAIVNRRIDRGKVGPGEGRTLLTMVHAWVWQDNPDGTFAQEHRGLPYLRAGLPPAWAEGADEEAALGVALLPPDGCAMDVRRTGRAARLDGGQERALTSACRRAASAVRAALARRRDAAAVNAAAAAAWESYEAARARTLRPGQMARMEALTEAAMEPHVM
jgi:hypothetical protein